MGRGATRWVRTVLTSAIPRGGDPPPGPPAAGGRPGGGGGWEPDRIIQYVLAAVVLALMILAMLSTGDDNGTVECTGSCGWH